MSAVLPYLGVAFVAAVVVAIFWWILSLSGKPRTQRSSQQPRRAVHQPWGGDKAGRGTR